MSSPDFSPESRNSAWWSMDSRKAADGKAGEVILTKLGKLPIPDLSQVEAVQMGHVMEPVIGRLAQSRLGIELNKIDDALAHRQHPWMRSHFDFVGVEHGEQILVEAKNYGSHRRNLFDPDSGLMPASDLAQCVHEAAVFGVSTVYLAVLFGGQEFTLTRVNVTDAMKDDLIQQMSVYWGQVVAGVPLPPETPEQARILYPQAQQAVRTASKALEEACLALRTTKAQIKALEAQEEALQTMVMGYLQDNDTLASIDGNVLATWKQAKASRKFDAEMFRIAMPDIYNQFVRDMPGSRRLLIK